MKNLKTKFGLTAVVAGTVLAATITIAATAAPTQITCKHTDMATISHIASVSEYTLKSAGQGAYEAHFTKVDGSGKLIQDINIAADDYALSCNFGTANALVFYCHGGSRMTPFYSSSEKLTTERISRTGEIEAQSHYTVMIYKGSSPFPPKPDTGPTETEFAVNDCSVN